MVLYELGGVYFVEDSNHRVSVASYQGVTWIDAQVTRYHAPEVRRIAGEAGEWTLVAKAQPAAA